MRRGSWSRVIKTGVDFIFFKFNGGFILVNDYVREVLVYLGSNWLECPRGRWAPNLLKWPTAPRGRPKRLNHVTEDLFAKS